MSLWAPAAQPLIRVCNHPWFQVWAPRLLIWLCTRRASGVCWGFLSSVHSPGAEGLRAQEAMAAAENSLNSCQVPLFSLFLFEKFLLFKPPGPNKHMACLTAQPGSLPKLLQQTLQLAWGFSCPGPQAVFRDLTVLKHSSYRLIFQCPLQSLASDLHICWNTVVCSLCSSDQLGISLVLRGSVLLSLIHI